MAETRARATPELRRAVRLRPGATAHDPALHRAPHGPGGGQLFPEVRVAIGPAIEDGFYYDFSRPAPFTPEDLERIEARMRELVAADLPFIARGVAARAGHRVLRGARRAVQGGDPRRHRRRPRCPSTGRATSSTCAAAPTWPSTGAIRAFKLLSSSGAYWRGRREEADAPAHLRHGLAQPGGAGPAPLATRGGAQARPPEARPRAGAVRLPRRRARARRSGCPRAWSSSASSSEFGRECATPAATSRSRRPSW